MTEPIVPVNEDGSLTDACAQIVELADVAGLVTVGCRESAAQRAAEQLSLEVAEVDWLEGGSLVTAVDAMAPHSAGAG